MSFPQHWFAMLNANRLDISILKFSYNHYLRIIEDGCVDVTCNLYANL